MVQQELVKLNLLRLLDHNLDDLCLCSIVMKLLMEMLWLEFLLVYARLEHGVVLMSLIDLKKECSVLYHSKSLLFRLD